MICSEFKVSIESANLSELNTDNDVLNWLLKYQKTKMQQKWHRERYMPYNLPKNLIVELPWFYSLDLKQPWKKPLGAKG